MEVNITKKVAVRAKQLNIYMKVVDGFAADLVDDVGGVIFKYEGYVPSFMPRGHYGDYLILNIDIDSGQITNWPGLCG